MIDELTVEACFEDGSKLVRVLRNSQPKTPQTITLHRPRVLTKSVNSRSVSTIQSAKANSRWRWRCTGASSRPSRTSTIQKETKYSMQVRVAILSSVNLESRRGVS